MTDNKFSVGINFEGKINVATRAVWFKQFIEIENQFMEKNNLTLCLKFDSFCISVTDVKEIIKLFINNYKVFYEDAITIFHDNGLLKLNFFKRDKYFELYPSIVCKTLNDYNIISEFLIDSFKHIKTENNYDKRIIMYWYMVTDRGIDNFRIVEHLNELFTQMLIHLLVSLIIIFMIILTVRKAFYF